MRFQCGNFDGEIETGVQNKVITKQKLFSIQGPKQIQSPEPKQIEGEPKQIRSEPKQIEGEPKQIQSEPK
jgi:hypothetical protein